LTAFLYDGAIEVVEAFLPGKTDEEILITAHLCHPYSSANDNASGVAAGMEAFHALQELLQKGELEPLERGIRMIFMPEFTGTFPWLHELGEEGRKKIKAGLNLDMVGARQGEYYGPLTLSAIPDSTPNLVWDAALFVMDEIMKSAPSLSNETATICRAGRSGWTYQTHRYPQQQSVFLWWCLVLTHLAPLLSSSLTGLGTSSSIPTLYKI
jgi:hypothetical protein